MATKFNFKLDPQSLPKLDVDGTNYLDWQAAWKRAFRYAGLGDVIDGTKARLNAAAVEERTAYDRQDDQAMVMLLSSVSTELTSKIVTAPSAHEAWKSLADQSPFSTRHDHRRWRCSTDRRWHRNG